MEMRANYCGFPISDEQVIDTEVVSKVIAGLHRGKAADAAGLAAEHLVYSHPSIFVVLSKLFRLIMVSEQFGFKKGSGCRNAIYSVQKAVDKIVKTGNTANICSIDLSKAFDKVNHYGMYVKLMKRLIPTELLE